MIPQNQCTDDAAHCASLAAGEQGTADHCSGDGPLGIRLAQQGIAGCGVDTEVKTCNACENRSQNEGFDLYRIHMDSGGFGRLLIAAHRVNGPAKGCAVENDPGQHDERQDEQYGNGIAGAPGQEFG